MPLIRSFQGAFMTRANSTQSSPEPKKPHPKQSATDFERPDSEQATEGAPAHEQGGTAGLSHPGDDAKHGYSQDSGYQSSGGNGNEAPDKKRSSTEVSDESRTPFDHDVSSLPGK